LKVSAGALADPAIWLGTATGDVFRVARVTGDKTILNSEKVASLKNPVTSVVSTSTGAVYVVTEEGLHRLARGSEQFAALTKADKSPLPGVLQVVEDRATPGRVWILTAKNLYSAAADQAAQEYAFAPGFS